MRQEFHTLKINTNGQKLYEFTKQTLDWIEKLNLKNGILNLSILHTSASIIVQENADPDVQKDLINYFDKLVPMKNDLYIHKPWELDIKYQESLKIIIGKDYPAPIVVHEQARKKALDAFHSLKRT